MSLKNITEWKYSGGTYVEIDHCMYVCLLQPLPVHDIWGAAR